jgi:hypothetical protein
VELTLEPVAVAIEQGSQDLQGFVEASPALLESKADGRVVACRGSRPHPGDQATAGEDVDRGQGLGQLHRPA